MPLKPLNPLLHRSYAAAVTWSAGQGRDPLPVSVRDAVGDLIKRRATAPDDGIEAIDAAIVAQTYWYLLRPDEIARETIRHWRFPARRPLSIEQASVVLAAIGEAGYPIDGNGAPDLTDCPTRGPERDLVIWSAAKYWAVAASRHLMYVSLGDARGFLPRPVQYDHPGSINPSQQAALTFGPACDRGDQCDSVGLMRSHTRRLVLVRPEAAAAPEPERRHSCECQCDQGHRWETTDDQRDARGYARCPVCGEYWV